VTSRTRGCDTDHGVISDRDANYSSEGDAMAKDDRDVIEVLKSELQFVEQGGYGRLPRESWRPRFIFEDSPTCLNFNSTDRAPCEECLLMQFVPEDARTEPVPCMHIPFSLNGQTLESLYRTGTQQEIEEALGAWLRATIHRLEAEKAKQTVPTDSPR
jgi:hypothetical protein